MKTNSVLFAVAAIVLATMACVQDLIPAQVTNVQATATVQPAPTQTPYVLVVTATNSLTDGLVVENTPTPIAQAAAQVRECSLTDGTAQIQLTQAGNEWVVDPANLKVVAGYNNTAPGHDVSKLSGCDMWAEYESPTTKEHIIVVLRDDPAKPLSYLNTDGMFYIPTPKGGSFWVGPADWNTANFSTVKPPIAYEMAAERNENQLTNVSGSYDWPEIVKLPDGSIKTFEVGYVYGAYYTGCNDLKTPAPFYVAGTIVGTQYNASIGMAGCYMVVKLDGTWTYWQDTKDNVLYTTVEAELFPSTASEKDVIDWIAKQK